MTWPHAESSQSAAIPQAHRRRADATERLCYAASPKQSPAANCRHTHATLALAAGIHPKVVSERLGHATVSITLDTYSHAIPAMQEEAAERIAGLVLAEG